MSLEDFQVHVKYQIIKYLFKCLHNFYMTDNIADIKFWDLESVEFEKIYHITPFRQQLLRNIFQKDITLQLYVLFVCNFSDPRIWEQFGFSSRGIIDLLRKILHENLNANAAHLAKLNFPHVLKHIDSRRYSSRNYNADSPYESSSRRQRDYYQRSERSSRQLSRRESISVERERKGDEEKENLPVTGKDYMSVERPREIDRLNTLEETKRGNYDYPRSDDIKR